MAEAEQSATYEERVQLALGRAYRYLDKRERTTTEVRSHLERHESDPAVVQGAIEELSELGALDDTRYARLFAQDKRELEQWGAERIRRTLLQRGIARELVEEAIAQPDGSGAHDGQSELDRALELLRRRFPSPPRERRERDRALGVLLRKGYDSELALDALTAYAREAAAPNLQ